MKQESIDILERQKKHWEQFQIAEYMKPSYSEQQEIERVVREEWKPGYTENLWCAACVAEMYKTAYNNYAEYLKKTAKPVVAEAAKEIIPVNNPAEGQRVQKPKKSKP